MPAALALEPRTPDAVLPDELLETLESARFGVQYEPIVEIATGERIAFEALARFHRADGELLPPGPVFSLLHAAPSLLLETEVALKRLQLERAPGRALFVNLDPDSFAAAPDGGAELLSILTGAPLDVVVEATENLDAADARRGRLMVAALEEAGLPFALDDVGADSAILSFDLLSRAGHLKFDRSILGAPREPRRLALVEALVRMCARTGARPILEGVETISDLGFARDLGIPLVQGYLFREGFVQVTPSR